MSANRYVLSSVAAAFIFAGCGSGSSPKVCSDVSGTSCNWAGVVGSRGYNGEGLHRAETWLYFVEDVTFAPDGTAWVLDWNNHRVRRIKADNTFETVIGTDYEGDGPPGEIDRLPAGAPQGAPGLEVALNHPTDVEFFPDGRVALAAWHNNKVRIWEPDTGRVTVIAGNSYGYKGDDGPAYAAVFNQPKAIAIDEEGNIYTNDQRNQRIRKITTGATPMISTIAGNGMKGAMNMEGPALETSFNFDAGVTPIPSGSLAFAGRDLYIADSLNHVIRKMNLDTNMITTVAGNGTAGSGGDGGPALQAQFNFPIDIEFGPDGRLYVADRFNNAIRVIDLAAGTVDRFAGNGQACPPQSTLCTEPKDGVNALEVQLNEPYGIAFDAAGHLYISDTLNSRVVRIAK